MKSVYAVYKHTNYEIDSDIGEVQALYDADDPEAKDKILAYIYSILDGQAQEGDEEGDPKYGGVADEDGFYVWVLKYAFGGPVKFEGKPLSLSGFMRKKGKPLFYVGGEWWKDFKPDGNYSNSVIEYNKHYDK